MNPIRVYQCKQDCCVVRVPSKRFWYIEWSDLCGKEQATSFRAAIEVADIIRRKIPQEQTS